MVRLPGMVHSKIVVVDGAICDIGSANFTPLSHGVYDEINLYAVAPELARDLEAVVDQHSGEGEVVTGRIGYRRIHSGVERVIVAYQSRKGGRLRRAKKTGQHPRFTRRRLRFGRRPPLLLRAAPDGGATRITGRNEAIGATSRGSRDSARGPVGRTGRAMADPGHGSGSDRSQGERALTRAEKLAQKRMRRMRKLARKRARRLARLARRARKRDDRDSPAGKRGLLLWRGRKGSKQPPTRR